MVIIAAAIVLDFTPLGGTIKFYTTWISCGHRPVVTKGSGYLNDNALSYSTPSVINLMPGDQVYYCSPIEAERAGYSANENQYEFPHLREAGEPTPFLKKYKDMQNSHAN